jgi:hypothetical protein
MIEYSISFGEVIIIILVAFILAGLLGFLAGFGGK